MPEGHTIRRLARTHTRHFAGHPLAVSSPQGRFERGAELVDGRVLHRVDAHGKHLFHVYEPDLVVHVHLGLYGKFTQHHGPVTEPRGQVRMRMVRADEPDESEPGEDSEDAGRHWADLRGAITCEVLDEGEVDAVRARLGPDPLRRDADPEAAWRRIGRSRSPLATLLMDQSVIAGVGNVYRAEVLFRHGLDPQTPGRDLGHDRFEALWADLVGLLGDGVRRGAIDTVRPEHRDSRRGRAVYVYRRDGDPCRVCATPVRRGTHAARNLFWCPHCQA